MRVAVTSVFVDDQAAALDFYTRVLGFETKHDIPLGDYRWLTVVAPEARDGVELLLEPAAHPAARTFREALRADGIPFTNFAVDDCVAEVERLRDLGVTIVREATPAGPVTTAILDDSCGNLIQLVSGG